MESASFVRSSESCVEPRPTSSLGQISDYEIASRVNRGFARRCAVLKLSGRVAELPISYRVWLRKSFLCNLWCVAAPKVKPMHPCLACSHMVLPIQAEGIFSHRHRPSTLRRTIQAPSQQLGRDGLARLGDDVHLRRGPPFAQRRSCMRSVAFALS